MYGKLIFMLIVDSSEKVLGTKIRMLAKLLSFSEKKISKAMKELGVVVDQIYEYDEFELFFFSLINENEQQILNSIPNSP